MLEPWRVDSSIGADPGLSEGSVRSAAEADWITIGGRVTTVPSNIGADGNRGSACRRGARAVAVAHPSRGCSRGCRIQPFGCWGRFRVAKAVAPGHLGAESGRVQSERRVLRDRDMPKLCVRL